MSDAVRVFKALSDGTRLRILNILLERECCVCEVMQALGISQPSASRHMSIMHEAGLLSARKEGIWMNYSLNWQGMPDYAREAVQSVKLALVDNSEALADREKLRQTVKQNYACVDG